MSASTSVVSDVERQNPSLGMATQISLFLLTLTFTLVRGMVDFGQCYAEHVACFGILNGMRSWGSNDGCIMHGNCNIILYARKNEENEYYFTLISRWRSDFNSSSARFEITNLDTVPFDPMEHMQAVVQRNRFQTIAWADVYHDNKRIKMNTSKPAWSSTYYYFNNENSDTQTLVDFNTKGPRLEYFGPGVENFPRTNLEDYVHVHLQFHKNGQLIDFGSTDQKFLLFRPKNSGNSPTTTPDLRTRPPVVPPAPTAATRTTRPPITTTTQRTTTTTTQRITTNTKRTTTTTQAPTTQRTKEAKEEQTNPDETQSFSTTSSQDSFSGSESTEKPKGNKCHHNFSCCNNCNFSHWNRYLLLFEKETKKETSYIQQSRAA